MNDPTTALKEKLELGSTKAEIEMAEQIGYSKKDNWWEWYNIIQTWRLFDT